MGIKNKFFLDEGLLVDISTGDLTLQDLGEYQEKLKKDVRLPLDFDTWVAQANLTP
jgi:hypothetical protein